MAPLSQASKRALARLRAFRPPPTIYGQLPLTRRAAVLLLLFADRQGELRVVLTVRSSTLNTYAGQVALPGGKADTLEETPFETARREAEEEIGLPRNPQRIPPPFQVEHLCELHTALARTELGVRPCVAYLHTGTGDAGADMDVEESLIPRLDAREVAAVFTAPFRKFLSDGRDDPAGSLKWYRGEWIHWNDSNWRMHSFFVPSTGKAQPDETYKVFGLTARLLIDAARIAYDEVPVFEHNAGYGEEQMLRHLADIGRLTEEKQKGATLSKEDMAEAARFARKNKM